MGKDLKGKELGVGICQRKDGLYTARYVGKDGKRKQKYFKKIQECRKWLADSRFQEEHGNINCTEMTVDAWFDYWIMEIKGKTLRWTTIQNYNNRYKKNVEDVIGNMLLMNVKPMHCQNVLNVMDDSGYKSSSIDKTRSMMAIMFSDALENGLIQMNPVTRSVKIQKRTEGEKEEKVLTVDEQRMFLETASRIPYYNHFLFVLQTGVRMSELRGLKWSDIDFKNRKIHISRNLVFDSINNQFVEGKTKTSSGVRDIPMTQEVYNILIEIKNERKKSKITQIEFNDYIFLNKNGKPIPNDNYDSSLKAVCKRAGIKQISMHTLRHTFATRCIESGMKPNTLKKILGHSNISTTMDLYAHVTEDEKEKDMEQFERMFRAI